MVTMRKQKLYVNKSRGWKEKSQDSFPVSLFNLEVDFAEENNLATQFTKTVSKLESMLLEFDKNLAN